MPVLTSCKILFHCSAVFLLHSLLFACLVRAQQPGNPVTASSESNHQTPGAILIFSYVTSDAANSNNTDTRLSITNTSFTTFARIRLFFVNGSSGSVNGFSICLTQNQTFSLRAVDTFPGETGWLLAVAVDQNGCPTGFNYLTGEAAVRVASGHRASYHAEAIAALFAGTLPGCTVTATAATLNFDGTSYARLPRAVAFDNLRSPGNNNSTLLALNRIGGDLTTTAASIGAVSGLLSDEVGNNSPFSFTHNSPQLVSPLTDAFPVTTPVFSTLIGGGHYGWMKLHGDTDIGLLGLMLNLNPNAATSGSVFTGGRALHKLTATSTSTITIPITALSCE